MRHILIFLIIVIISQAKDIKLVATVKYTNTSSQTIENIVHRLTIPEERYYQSVKEINVVPQSLKYTIKKRKNYDTRYVRLILGNLKPNESIEFKVSYIISQKNMSVDFENSIFPTNRYNKEFLKESKYVEVEAKEFKSIAYLIEQSQLKSKEKLKMAFKFPAQYLDYTIQKKTTALTALKSGIGDCTEYAMVFIALARNLGFESRRASVFNFSKNKVFKAPNHHIAEVYIKDHGWMPVYPNLSEGGKKQRYQLGKVAPNIILYNYRTWVWSRSIKKSQVKLKKFLKTKVSWKVDEKE